MIRIVPVPAFQDNYIWLIAQNNHAWVVDPGDASPVIQYLSEHQLVLKGILLTHHHFDHIGGVDKLVQAFKVPVYGNPQKIRQVTEAVREGDQLTLEDISLNIIDVPGHTLDHIAYFGEIEGQGMCLFCGDTLFSAGCGRLFEGTPETMYQSLAKLTGLPANTKIFCTHEYTMANLAFAKAVLPDSDAVHNRIKHCQNIRSQNLPTLPAILSEELTYNPFLMSKNDQVIKAASQRLGRIPENDIETFGAIREWKDNF